MKLIQLFFGATINDGHWPTNTFSSHYYIFFAANFSFNLFVCWFWAISYRSYRRHALDLRVNRTWFAMRKQRRKNYLTDIDPLYTHYTHTSRTLRYKIVYTWWWSLIKCAACYSKVRALTWCSMLFCSSFCAHNRRSMQCIQHLTFNGNEKNHDEGKISDVCMVFFRKYCFFLFAVTHVFDGNKLFYLLEYTCVHRNEFRIKLIYCVQIALHWIRLVTRKSERKIAYSINTHNCCEFTMHFSVFNLCRFGESKMEIIPRNEKLSFECEL